MHALKEMRRHLSYLVYLKTPDLTTLASLHPCFPSVEPTQLSSTITQDNLVCRDFSTYQVNNYLFRRSLGVRFSGDTAERWEHSKSPEAEGPSEIGSLCGCLVSGEHGCKQKMTPAVDEATWVK